MSKWVLCCCHLAHKPYSQDFLGVASLYIGLHATRTHTLKYIVVCFLVCRLLRLSFYFFQTNR